MGAHVPEYGNGLDPGGQHLEGRFYQFSTGRTVAIMPGQNRICAVFFGLEIFNGLGKGPEGHDLNRSP